VVRCLHVPTAISSRSSFLRDGKSSYTADKKGNPVNCVRRKQADLQNAALQNQERQIMSKSRRKLLKTNVLGRRDTLVDWGSLLSVIADDLDACITELRARRRRILEVQTGYFVSNKPFEEPTTEGLENLASALCRLDHGIEYVIGRFGQLRPKAFQHIAGDAIRDRKDFDLDSE
jgi:hypothetical protein